MIALQQNLGVRWLPTSITVETNPSRQFATELERSVVSQEAHPYITGGESLEPALEALRAMPTGLGTDGFFLQLTGFTFPTWKAELERQTSDVTDATL